MARVLVTGGGGQFGGAFRQLDPGADVLNREQLDITDRDRVFQVIADARPSIVINAAAFTAVDLAETEPDAAHKINAVGAGLVAEASAAAGAKMIQVSTDYVYPGDKDGPYVETDKTGPASAYGKSKLEGEQAVLQVAPGALVVRTSWVFGEGVNFIKAILKAAGGATATTDGLSVVDDQKGLPTYAPDLAAGLLQLIEAGAKGVYHLAGGGPPVTWAGLAEYAISTAGLDVQVKPVTTQQYESGRPGPFAPRPRNSVLDCSKAARLGVALRPWTESVKAYLESGS